MIELVSRIADTLAGGASVVAATIVTNEGSTPRTAGSKMLIFADGTIAGTVGGGLAEGMRVPCPAVVSSSTRPRRPSMLCLTTSMVVSLSENRETSDSL